MQLRDEIIQGLAEAATQELAKLHKVKPKTIRDRITAYEEVYDPLIGLGLTRTLAELWDGAELSPEEEDACTRVATHQWFSITMVDRVGDDPD